MLVAVGLHEGSVVGPGFLQVCGEVIDGAGRSGAGDEDTTGCGGDSGEEENDSFHAGLRGSGSDLVRKLSSAGWMQGKAQRCSATALGV